LFAFALALELVAAAAAAATAAALAIADETGVRGSFFTLTLLPPPLLLLALDALDPFDGAGAGSTCSSGDIMARGMGTAVPFLLRLPLLLVSFSRWMHGRPIRTQRKHGRASSHELFTL